MELRDLIKALLDCIAEIGDCKVFIGTDKTHEILNGCVIRNHCTTDGDMFLIIEGKDMSKEVE